jgi:hypothetical protein
MKKSVTEKEKRELGISKRLGGRMRDALNDVDGDCKLTQINEEILNKQMSREMISAIELIDGGLTELLDWIKGLCFDNGFAMGYAAAQIFDISDRRFKATIENIKKVIMDRGALPKIRRL